MVFSDFTYTIFSLKEKRLFLVDYHLLEKVKRIEESAQRKRANCKGILNLRFHIVFKALRMLREVAGRNSYSLCRGGRKINLHTAKGNYVFVSLLVLFN